MGKPKTNKPVNKGTRSRRQTAVAAGEEQLLFAMAECLRLAEAEPAQYELARAKFLSVYAQVRQMSFDSGWYTPELEDPHPRRDGDGDPS